MTTQLWSVVLVVIADLIGSFASILLKIGSGSVTRDWRNIMADYRRTLMLFGGLALFGISAIIFTIALRGGELSVLYPFVSIGYIFIVLLSKMILKERINVWKAGGIGFIILGVVLIGFGS